MSDYDYLPASNGSGDAAVMTITSNRAVSATTLNVDSVTNVPTKFIGTSGTLLSSGFIDPATVTNFKGHVSGGTLVIDSFEAGSTDVGNTAGQVVVVKPSTGWANRVASFIKNATGFGTPEDLHALSLTSDTLNEATVDNGINVDGLLIKDGKLATAGAAADMQSLTVGDTTKTTYSSASWTTFKTISYTPNISGTLALFLKGEFGFQTSAVSAAFRMQVNGTTVGQQGEHLDADTSFTSLFGTDGVYGSSVTAGTAYTITLQTISVGGTYAYYILAVSLLALVTR